jgi:hypothetical protein
MRGRMKATIMSWLFILLTLFVPPQPRVESVTGMVTITSGGHTEPLRAGMILKLGDVVRTEADGHALLRIGGKFEVFADSTCVIRRPAWSLPVVREPRPVTRRVIAVRG